MSRMITFLKSKLKQVPNKSSDLVKTTLPTISFTPLKVKLSFVKNAAISIKPRKIYHPTIINACEAMFKKHPDQLVSEEIIKFNHYRNWKTEMGDPLESNVVYLPAGGLRTCLVCGHLT